MATPNRQNGSHTLKKGVKTYPAPVRSPLDIASPEAVKPTPPRGKDFNEDLQALRARIKAEKGTKNRERNDLYDYR